MNLVIDYKERKEKRVHKIFFEKKFPSHATFRIRSTSNKQNNSI